MKETLRKTVPRLDIYAEEVLQELSTFLKMAKDGGVAICICNAPAKRSEILTAISDRVKSDRMAIYTLNMDNGQKSLVRLIKSTLNRKDFKELQTQFSNVALSVSGLDRTVPSETTRGWYRPEPLQILNQQRDYFLELKHPVLLWVPEWLAAVLPRLAPDFFRIRSGVFEFRTLREEMSEAMQRVSEMPHYYESLEDINRRIRIYEKLLKGMDESKESDRRRLAGLNVNLGDVLRARGDYDQALTHYRKSLEISEKLGDLAGISTSYHQIGMVYHARGDYDQALTHYRKSLEIKEKLGDLAGIASSHGQIGRLFFEREEYESAAEHFLIAFSLFQKMGRPEVDLARQYVLAVREKIGDEQLRKMAERMGVEVDM